jgi:hypothetical protein
VIAEAGTPRLITCLKKENNLDGAPRGGGWQGETIPGKIVGYRPTEKIVAQAGLKQAGGLEMVEFANRAVIPSHVLVRHLDGESVLLNLETEKYFGLDATGTRMWELVTNSPTIELAYGQLVEEFEVEPEILRNHLEDLLSELRENGLLNVLPADVGTTPAI